MTTWWDGGSTIFAEVIREIRKRSDTVIEVLIPDFRGHADDLKRVIAVAPEVINHNIETVERLHPVVRPSARYDRSLELLERVKSWGGGIKAKSGIMLGLGEQKDEVERTLRDLVTHGCDLLTIGQYLRPTPNHLPVVEYVHPDQFLAGASGPRRWASAVWRVARWCAHRSTPTSWRAPCGAGRAARRCKGPDPFTHAVHGAA